MKMTIDLPESTVVRAAAQAREACVETSEWISEVLIQVIKTNEIHHLRKDMIDWREELLS
ncbi:MAG TPA: hypothetical protein VM511_13745 [Luteolibacter sp.]|jgi:hypothetical protein|nr:hypothetical protein [Luteolibacter sp.]